MVGRSGRVITVRLADGQHEALEGVAKVDDVSMNEVARQAFDRHVAARRADPVFQDRLRRVAEQDRALLDRLAQ